MAFALSSRSATLIKRVGVVSQPKMSYGVVALVGGTVDVTIPGAKRILAAFCESQTSNAARHSASSGSAFTITGTGTDIVEWLAIWE